MQSDDNNSPNFAKQCDKAFNDEIKKEIDSFMKKMARAVDDAYMDSIIYGTGIAEIHQLPRGYQKDRDPHIGNRVYSSILKKFINPDTGKPVED